MMPYPCESWVVPSARLWPAVTSSAADGHRLVLVLVVGLYVVSFHTVGVGQWSGWRYTGAQDGGY